ncbi:PREDICTED: complement component C8 gamma chain [Chrysochloris asiatica]|uniref:Complement component C8 gamma chain n=1 Tax=Chrysochloris asiatica TaxID=185453 RepID=A0A9B0TF63_CHRAS|nr:PREDICTED: complement component C8 gamma chain [Chrysochloris asiatica]
MLPPKSTLLLILALNPGSLGRRAQRPPRPAYPINAIHPKANFNAQQFAGTWFLVAVASTCHFLQEQSHQTEATALHVTPQGESLAVSTFRKLDGICWQIRQLYRDTGIPGRLLLQARGARGAVDVVVGETDYRDFAILYLERARKLSLKLYARSLPVSDLVLSEFEQRVQSANLTEDSIFFFPKYGFCEVADQFHVLDGPCCEHTPALPITPHLISVLSWLKVPVVPAGDLMTPERPCPPMPPPMLQPEASSLPHFATPKVVLGTSQALVWV